MTGSSIGKLCVLSSFGESHGPALGGTFDGCPAGLALSEADIQPDLDRRKPGTSRYTTQRKEPDQVRILSGVFEGKTTGCPIGLLIENTDQRSRDYANIADNYRPGHADYVYDQKYGFRDYRGGGRSSARETAIRVAAGAIAKKYLAERHGMLIRGYMAAMGPISIDRLEWDEVGRNPFFCPDPDKVAALEALITQLRRDGDSIGARINVLVTGMPTGLGEPVFDRLDADLAKALMSINAVKGVEVGDGFAVVNQRGTLHRDAMHPEGFASNHAGGILGGISSGQNLRLSIALKPTSSLTTPGATINRNGQACEVVTKGRHDPCVGVRATPIAEAMTALILMDHSLRQDAKNRQLHTPCPPIASGQDLHA